MRKYILMAVAFLAMGLGASAQKQFKLAKSSGTLVLDLPAVIVEGYDGNEIIFSGKAEMEDERAAGLSRMSSSGHKDNTGVGLQVLDKGQTVDVHAVGSRLYGTSFSIKVPQNMKIVLKNDATVLQGNVEVNNMKNELEISVSHNPVKLMNNSGPVNVKSLYGTIEAVFSSGLKGPISLVSVYGLVDATLPGSVKANLDMSTSFGKLYASDSFNIVIDPVKEVVNKDEKYLSSAVENNKIFETTSGALTRASTIISGLNMRGDVIKGKIGGGGLDMILKSNYKSVYLRAK